MYEINSLEIRSLVSLYKKIVSADEIDNLHKELLEKIIYISQHNSLLANLLNQVDSEKNVNIRIVNINNSDVILTRDLKCL
jgi:hypothetical protein